MNIDQMITAKKNELAGLLATRSTNVTELANIRQLSALGPQDETRVRELRAANADIDRQANGLEAKIAEYQAERAADQAVDALSAQSIPGAKSPSTAYDNVARTAGGRLYRADDAQAGRPSFLSDLYASQIKHDPAAGERLAQHGREVETDSPGWNKRTAGTGAVSGFVPPAYLSDMFAELARAGRPIADLCTGVPLPEVGMTVNVPRITTGTTTAVQASEGSSVANQDIDDTLVTAPVVTVAGYTDLSRQAIERAVLVEEIVFGDLAADYNSKLDAQVINGSGSSGQHLGILGVSGTNSVTYTDASPTVAEIWPKLADLVRKIVSQRFTGATGIAMTPDMWGWFLAAQDSTGRPLIDSSGTGQNSLGTTAVPAYEGAAGSLLKVPVYLSGNIPTNLGAGTNEARIFAADFRDLFLFEDQSKAPAQLRFDDVLSGTLGVRLLAYGYSGFIGGRQPKAISVLSGTGLIPQSL